MFYASDGKTDDNFLLPLFFMELKAADDSFLSEDFILSQKIFLKSKTLCFWLRDKLT